LVVEDDEKMASLVRRALEQDGYVVQTAGSGAEALWAAREIPPAAVVLDTMIPEPDGFEVCRSLRREGCGAPVIMVTARDAITDRIAGLDAGADDYLVKPFSLGELLARLRALLRRGDTTRATVIEVGEIRLDPATKEVTRLSEVIDLSPREYALLDMLMRRAGQVLTRSEILDHVWDVEYEGTSNVVNVYIGYLREKLDRPFGTDSIKTVRGHGYLLKVG
jgi:two-component system OmpR family response regulator